jgi:hypothetical protein
MYIVRIEIDKMALHDSSASILDPIVDLILLRVHPCLEAM